MAVAVAAMGAAPAALEPDARLQAIAREAEPLFRQHEQLTDQWFALRETDRTGIGAVSDTLDPVYDRVTELIDLAAPLRASTAAGFRAKAVLLRFEFLVNNRTDAGLSFDTTGEEAAFRLFNEMIAAGAA